MLDALKERLDQLETVGERALPAAASNIQNKLWGDVKKSRRAARKRRRVERAERRLRGDTRRVSMGRKTSGISIEAVVVGSTIVVTASDQVHYIAREKTEPESWVDILREEVLAAGDARLAGRR